MLTIKSKLNNFKRNSTLRKLIKPNERVLEIGVGTNPSGKSNILLDKYVDTSELHRSNKKKISHFGNKPFILADGNQLPFKNKSIDVIICRHVIEHMDKPEKFLYELQRVALKGYLEWPSVFCELIRGGYGNQNEIRALFSKETEQHLAHLEHGKGTLGHKWFIESKDRYIYFLAKQKALYPLYLMFGTYIKKGGGQKLLRKLASHSISYQWWNKERKLEAVNITGNAGNDTSRALNETYNLQEQLKRLNEIPPKDIPPCPLSIRRLQESMCCPVCKDGSLSATSKTSLLCSICGSSYPVINNIPVLLEQAAKKQN
jgi:uncharacterized protein YbaR (Trm112 family)/SAM-dependent methyltransferase